MRMNRKKIITGILIIFALIHYWGVLEKVAKLFFQASVPLLLGIVVAYVVNILMNYYEKYYRIICKWSAIRKFRRPFCLFLAFLTLFLLLVVLWQMIIPVFAACIATAWRSLPETLDAGVSWIRAHSKLCCSLLDKSGFMVDGVFDWDALTQEIAEMMIPGISKGAIPVMAVIQSAASIVFQMLLALIFAVYLLLRKEKLKRDSGRLISVCIGEKAWKKLRYILKEINRSFHNYIVGQCIEAVILGSLCMLGMLLFGLPYAAMVGSFIGFTALIPIAGAYIGAAVGAVMIYTVSPYKAVFFLIFLFILQQLENNLIYPRVVGSSIGLPGLWVLAAVIIGGSVCGIPGMFIGVPLTAAGYHLLKEWMGRKRR